MQLVQVQDAALSEGYLDDCIVERCSIFSKIDETRSLALQVRDQVAYTQSSQHKSIAYLSAFLYVCL
jgi:hypothetical protein